jgi:hypothetical protein
MFSFVSLSARVFLFQIGFYAVGNYRMLQIYHIARNVAHLYLSLQLIRHYHPQ